MRDSLKDPWSESWVQISQAVRYRIVVHVFSALEMGRYRDFLQPVPKSERLLHFSFPVNDMSDNLVLTIEVAASCDLFYARVQFLLSNFL